MRASTAVIGMTLGCCVSLTHAQTVHKCVIDGAVTYTDQTCARSEHHSAPPASGAAASSPAERRAQADARRAQEAARREKIQQGFKAPALGAAQASPQAGAAPKAAPTQSVVSLPRDVAVDRMTTYTTVLGRGIACGATGTDVASHRIGAWMDAQGLTQDFLLVAAEGIRYAAELQRQGRTQDSCATVRAQFVSFPWP